jgi:hypothetical protein
VEPHAPGLARRPALEQAPTFSDDADLVFGTANRGTVGHRNLTARGLRRQRIELALCASPSTCSETPSRASSLRGARPVFVSRQLGHADAAITLVYAHRASDDYAQRWWVEFSPGERAIKLARTSSRWRSWRLLRPFWEDGPRRRRRPVLVRLPRRDGCARRRGWAVGHTGTCWTVVRGNSSTISSRRWNRVSAKRRGAGARGDDDESAADAPRAHRPPAPVRRASRPVAGAGEAEMVGTSTSLRIAGKRNESQATLPGRAEARPRRECPPSNER